MLKSPSGIVFGLGSLAAATAVACLFQRKAINLPGCAMFVGLGAMVSMTIALLIIGPGNLWPLVIAFDSFMIGAAAAVGLVIASLFRRGNAA